MAAKEGPKLRHAAVVILIILSATASVFAQGSADIGQSLEDLKNGKLSAQQVAVIADSALALQADPKFPWDPRWGDFVQLAHNEKLIPDKVWYQYLLGAVQLQWRVEKQATRDAELVVHFAQDPSRTGSKQPNCRMIGWCEQEISGNKIDYYPARGFGGPYTCIYLFEKFADLPEPFGLDKPPLDALKPGPQTFHCRFHLVLLPADLPEKDWNPAHALASRVFERTDSWTLLPAHIAPPHLPPLKPDPALHDAIEKGFILQAFRDFDDKTLVTINVQMDHAPTNLGFRAAFVAGGKTYPLGYVAWSPQSFSNAYMLKTDLPESVQSAELVLVADPQSVLKARPYADSDLNTLDSIWDGTIRQQVEFANTEGGVPGEGPPTLAQAFWEEFDAVVGTDSAIQQFRKDRDADTARKRIEKAVQEHPGDFTALYNLACLTVASGDWREAPPIFARVRAAAPAGSISDAAQFRLRELAGYYIGASAQYQDPRLMFEMAQVYDHGWGTLANPQYAKRWYRDAANAGDADAMVRLAQMYSDAMARASTPKAQVWYKAEIDRLYRKAAGLGNKGAEQWVAQH